MAEEGEASRSISKRSAVGESGDDVRRPGRSRGDRASDDAYFKSAKQIVAGGSVTPSISRHPASSCSATT